MKRLLIVGGVTFVLIVAAWLVVSSFSLSALGEPGKLETHLASMGKRLLIRRASRQGSLSEPPGKSDDLAEGKRLYSAECAMCHGEDGQIPTRIGRWMYPRAADLTSLEVQKYSDKELFWIIKNGIRLSGMPAFAKVVNDEQTWQLVRLVRSLNSANQLQR